MSIGLLSLGFAVLLSPVAIIGSMRGGHAEKRINTNPVIYSGNYDIKEI